MKIQWLKIGLIFLGVSLMSAVCQAQPALKKTAKPTASKKIATMTKAAPKVKQNVAATPVASRGPASTKQNDPNHAVEIRGQSRTLSMMLVLKNGKESINFIKIRKDYNPEIAATPF